MIAANRIGLASLTHLHWVAIGLALATGLVHLILGLEFLPHWMGMAFLLATAGFLLGIGLVVADYRRPAVYLLGISFTGAQIVLWYVLNEPAAVADLSSLELVDKGAQALLIVALVILYRRER